MENGTIPSLLLRAELSAVSRYAYHCLRFEEAGRARAAEEMDALAREEAEHYRALAAAFPCGCAEYGGAGDGDGEGSLEDMVLEDMRGERETLALLRSAARLAAGTAEEAMLVGIAERKRRHLGRLASLYGGE